MFGLLENSIESWNELTHKFISNFGMICVQKKTHYDLELVLQKEDESLHNYIKRWRDVKDDIQHGR